MLINIDKLWTHFRKFMSRYNSQEQFIITTLKCVFRAFLSHFIDSRTLRKITRDYYYNRIYFDRYIARKIRKFHVNFSFTNHTCVRHRRNGNGDYYYYRINLSNAWKNTAEPCRFADISDFSIFLASIDRFRDCSSS